MLSTEGRTFARHKLSYPDTMAPLAALGLSSHPAASPVLRPPALRGLARLSVSISIIGYGCIFDFKKSKEPMTQALWNDKIDIKCMTSLILVIFFTFIDNLIIKKALTICLKI